MLFEIMAENWVVIPALAAVGAVIAYRLRRFIEAPS